MTRLLTVAGWATLTVLTGLVLLLALYEIGCAIEALRERRIEQRDPQDRWPR